MINNINNNSRKKINQDQLKLTELTVWLHRVDKLYRVCELIQNTNSKTGIQDAGSQYKNSQFYEGTAAWAKYPFPEHLRIHLFQEHSWIFGAQHKVKMFSQCNTLVREVCKCIRNPHRKSLTFTDPTGCNSVSAPKSCQAGTSPKRACT